MDEAFFHFIWTFQKFKKEGLQTSLGESVLIFFPGIHNLDSGPDFSEARIKIGEIEWRGHVEIHLNSSHWNDHRHYENSAYSNVILHVVWENNLDISREDGSTIPTIELKNRVDLLLLRDYKRYLSTPSEILCESQIPTVSSLTWISNLDSMLSRRLEEKAKVILQISKEINYDWEETTYRLLARNFGFSLNAEPFATLAETLPLKTILKHTPDSMKVFALIFGQAGFLEDCQDDYQGALQLEFRFLTKKYKLTQKLHRSHWKFGKMRPPNFPSIRLAQFAGIMNATQRLFSQFLEVKSSTELKTMLNIHLPDYWLQHYDFNKILSKGSNQIGTTTVNNLIINTVVPVLAAYAKHTDHTDLMERAVHFLEQLPPEKNRYTHKWEAIGKKPGSAFDSQAQITLFREFCSRKKCLNCTIGSSLFNR